MAISNKVPLSHLLTRLKKNNKKIKPRFGSNKQRMKLVAKRGEDK